MVFHAHGQPFVARIERRAFGNGPGEQRAAVFQSEIVVQMARQMFLHTEKEFTLLGSFYRFARLAGGFWRF